NACNCVVVGNRHNLQPAIGNSAQPVEPADLRVLVVIRGRRVHVQIDFVPAARTRRLYACWLCGWRACCRGCRRSLGGAAACCVAASGTSASAWWFACGTACVLCIWFVVLFRQCFPKCLVNLCIHLVVHSIG